MEEKEWETARRLVKVLLESMRTDVKTIKGLDVLLRAEDECCDSILVYAESILGRWDERNIVSRLRFVEGVRDE